MFSVYRIALAIALQDNANLNKLSTSLFDCLVFKGEAMQVVNFFNEWTPFANGTYVLAA